MTKKQKREVILTLKNNEIYNLSLIGFINENPIGKFVQNENSFFVKGKDGDGWVYFAGGDETEFISSINNLTAEDKYFGALDDWMIPIIIKNREVDWLINAYQFHFPGDKLIPENKIRTRKLTTKDSEFIVSQSVYKKMLSIKYLNERINKSVSAGIYEDKKLVAWALTHDDSSLGSMHVMENYRGKGYAKEVSISLIKQCREINKIPFLQCETKNIPAQNLVEKLGFVKDRNVTWLKLK